MYSEEGGSGADLMRGTSGKDSLNGRGGDDTLVGLAGNDVLIGGDDNDCINGGAGNDTLTGGNDSDIFVFGANEGNDVVTDYTAGEDIFQFTSGTPKFKVNDNDVVITVGSGKITVKGAANSVISYIDANGKEKSWPNTIDIDDETNTVKLAKGYARESFNLTGYADDLQTVDASAVTHDLSITGNAKANRIIGTEEDDIIDGGAGKDTIMGGEGNDSLNGGKGNDLLYGGKGNDTLTGGAGSDTFQYAKNTGKDVITDYDEEDRILFSSGTKDEIDISTSGDDVVFTLGKGKITVKDAANKTVTYVVGDEEFTVSPNKTVEYNNKGTSATLTSSFNADEFKFSESAYPGKLVSLNASAVEHDIAITGNKLANKITGGSGNDTIYGGKGNDILYGGAGDDVFVYSKGDGNDQILDYENADIISIASGVASYVGIKGDDIILSALGGRITVKGGADKNVHVIDANGEAYYPKPLDTFTISNNGKGVTLHEGFDDDSLNIATHAEIKHYASTIVTVDASALDHDIAITANKKANLISGGSGDDTIYGAKGNDTLKGGDGSDTFVFASGDGNDRILDYEEGDILQFTSGKPTFKKSGDDVIITLGKGKITVKGAADKVINYINKDGQELNYPEVPVSVNSAGTGVTLKSNYKTELFDVNTSSYVSEYSKVLKTIDGSAVTQDLEIVGNAKANRIFGSSNDDTIWGGKGNDTLTGGEGSDVFAFNSGDGKDVITDYTEGEDVIQFASGNVSNVKTSGKNVIFTVGKGTVTVKDGKGKTITYVDADGEEQIYPSAPYYVSGETVILTKDYSAKTFDLSNDSDLREVYNIDAARVDADLVVKGDNKANMIVCSGGANTIYGGKGNDTINGGDGSNLYVYNSGDGNDLILDWGAGDVVSIASGTKSGSVKVVDDTVIFTIGKGKISMQGAAGERLTWWEDGEKTSKIFTVSNNVLEDDNFITSNDLSSIVEDKAVDYSVMATGDVTSLTKSNNALPVLSPSKKK